jgi:hypothetical protein
MKDCGTKLDLKLEFLIFSICFNRAGTSPKPEFSIEVSVAVLAMMMSEPV